MGYTHRWRRRRRGAADRRELGELGHELAQDDAPAGSRRGCWWRQREARGGAGHLLDGHWRRGREGRAGHGRRGQGDGDTVCASVVLVLVLPGWLTLLSWWSLRKVGGPVRLRGGYM